MDYKDAIDALKKLEGTADLVPAVEAELERLTTKNYELIGENRKATAKARSLEDTLTDISTTLRLEGADLESKLSGAPEKVKSLSTQLSEATTKLTAAETRATTAEGKLGTLERREVINQAATKAGAVPAVLEQLLGDKVGELKIDETGVKVGDKPLKEYVEGDDRLKLFAPALFPNTQTGTSPTTPTLPNAPPTGTQPTEANPVDSYMSKTYKVAGELAK